MKKWIRYWIPVVGILSLIFFLSSKPASFYPEVDFQFADKIVHIFLYACVGFFFCRALTARYRLSILWQKYRIYMVASVILTIIYGITDEYHQSFVPGRSVEVADVIADAIGGILGAWMTVLYRRIIISIKMKRAR